MHTSYSTGENRLIMATLGDFGQTTVYNRRTAQLNADRQAAQRQAQLTLNKSTGQKVGSYTKYDQPFQYAAPVPVSRDLQNAQNTYANAASGLPSTATGTPGSSIFDQRTVTAASPYQSPQDRALETSKKINDLQTASNPFAGSQFSTESRMQWETDRQNQIAALEQQRATMAKEASDRAQRQAGSVGYNLQDSVNERLTNRLTKLEGTRGDFVDKKRTEINPETGKIYSDQEIKKLLQSMPVGTFSNEQPVQTPNSMQMQTSVPIPQDANTPQPAGTPQGSKTPANAPVSMQKDVTTQGSQDMPQAPIYPPQASAVRDMMTQLAKDNPLAGLYAAMYDEDVMRTKEAKANALLSLGASIQGAEQENLDTQAYIDKWVNIANQNSSKLTDLLQSQNDETNKVLEEQKSNALQKLEFDRQVQTQQMERQKAADVLKSSIAIGLRGGAYSGAAQNALAESEREWDVAIQNLGKEYSFKAADVMTDYTSKYVTAKQNLALNLLQASETLQNKIEGYANAGFTSLQAKKKAIIEAKNDYRSILDKLAQDNAKETKDLVTKMGEMVNKKRDDERAQEQLGINMLDKLVDTYGNNVPPSLLETVKKYIPNIDIQDVMKRRTLAQMKKGAGGVGAGVGVVLPANATIASLYTNITPQQLKEAVKRAFSPQNYGGNASERVKRENEYMSRIASGESPASIIQSLGSDYWSSQKGAQRTMHTERVTAQGSAESLQEFVDYYGIKAGDDGPLGSIDSRVQGLASVFGLSSEEYNNLATNVGNIRARIVKENYGAAVTPQELNLAKSYIPSMTDKGAQFVTKLQNFKSYQAYLDAKVLADSLGLPMPKPPSPVTLSGDKISGPSKFSVEDITSTLSE